MCLISERSDSDATTSLSSLQVNCGLRHVTLCSVIVMFFLHIGLHGRDFLNIFTYHLFLAYQAEILR